MKGTWQSSGGGNGGLVLAVVIVAAIAIGSGAASAVASALVTIAVVFGCVLVLAAAAGIGWLVWRPRRRDQLAAARARTVYQLAADRQARYARYRGAARSGMFGPPAHVNRCTLDDTLDVLGLDVDELERRALAQLAEGDPLIVAVVDELLNRAARNPYDPARYAAVPPVRQLRVIPLPGNPSTGKDTDH